MIAWIQVPKFRQLVATTDGLVQRTTSIGQRQALLSVTLFYKIPACFDLIIEFFRAPLLRVFEDVE